MANEPPVHFLDGHKLSPVTLKNPRDLEPVGLILGKGEKKLQVVVTRACSAPAESTLQAVWRDRQRGRAMPLLLVALYGEQAAVCGASGDNPPAYVGLDRGLVERLCGAALQEPNHHAALRFLRLALPEIKAPLPFLRNAGLFTTHELRVGVPQRCDWQTARERGGELLEKRDEELIRGLGFCVQKIPGQVHLLLIGEARTAVAVFLDRNETFDLANQRFQNLSPISYALDQADRENVSYVIVTRGDVLRLYPVEPGIGVGRRGRTETFIELDLRLLPDDQAAYLWLIFSAEALRKGGSFSDILQRSADYAAALGERLRERVYEQVVPDLAKAVCEALHKTKKPSKAQLAEAYQITLTLLFRLLFLAYAEDKELLPYRTNALYRTRSLKQKAHELQRVLQEGTGFDEGASHWLEVCLLFDAVDSGHREWGVPPYDGQLFSSDRAVSTCGAELKALALPNNVFGPILARLLLDDTPEGIGPVDFRELGVREFGTIYEGLLENELAVAETDLGLDREGVYKPESDPVVVKAGEVYLHNASGARKSSGSYFTKAFAVEHLLDQALEPALEAHLARLDQLPKREAGKRFFDFRVADIAMGSGHFLVAAVDRIERRFSGYLAKRRLPVVTKELDRLRAKAAEALAQLGETLEIEDTQLLRRQIARRCIYGVDINPLAVQLARVSLWIHTFVPGLPLSLLDRTLVQGNSLVGLATLDEVKQALMDLLPSESKGQQPGLLQPVIDALMNEAQEAIKRLGRLADADAAEVKKARQAWEKAKEAVRPGEALLDVLAAARLDQKLANRISIGGDDALDHLELPKIHGSPLHQEAGKVMTAIPPFHFPIAFPEVFLGDRPGFDCILGNPPWEKAHVEEHEFWARYNPGLRGVAQGEREKRMACLRKARPDLVKALNEEVQKADLLRRVLMTGPFPGMGTGHPDLYKAFCWRFWDLLNAGGRMGVVLPRSAWCAQGSEKFRKAVFTKGLVEDLTFLLNKGGWVFDDAHPQYTIALTAIAKTCPSEKTTVPLRGPFSSLDSYRVGMTHGAVRFPVAEVLRWTDTASLPLLPAAGSAEVFAQLRHAPRLDLNDDESWRARPLQGDMNATSDKPLMDLESAECPDGYWPIYKGESFDLWNPDTGTDKYYAWGDPKVLLPHLQQKRLQSARSRKSPFQEFDEAWLENDATLPCRHPRIAFRDVTNRTNQRTVIAALVPPNVFTTHKAPYFLWPRGDKRDRTFLLGVLSSLPLDWYARRFVETSMTFYVLNPFPIPRPARDNPLWQRTVALAGRLACPDERFAEWAQAVGVDCGPLTDDQKQDMIHELDAVVAHLYGLTEAHLSHIFETFHEGWDYKDRLEATVQHYRKWQERLQ